MSVIQKIRDKYARWAVIAIALSLLGFILMDAFAGRTGLFSDRPTNTLGKINGTTIDRLSFDEKLQAVEKRESAQAPIDENRKQQLMQMMWDQEISNILVAEESEKLGLAVTEKELRDILYGANPPQILREQFTDEKGQFNAIAAQQAINQMRKDPNRKEEIEAFFEDLKKERLAKKYMALLTNTIYFPKWFLEKRNVDNSLIAKVSYVSVPYSSIPDSSVKVSDQEIKDYINDHKENYEQKVESRSISYVQFSAAPSSADSAAAKAEVEKLKPEFAKAEDAAAYLAQQGTEIQFYDAYLGKSLIQVPVKDSIFATPKGSVYGPYLDGSNYVLAKVLDVKDMPDSAKARHILISTNNPQTGEVIRPDSLAKMRIDSIKLALANGISFDTLAKKLSDDKSSAERGGLLQIPTQSGEFLDYFAQGKMVRAFNDSVFNGKVGQIKIVRSEFGWHLIEILDLKNIEPHYKIAYLAKPIYTSNKTDQTARNQANLFAGNSRDLKAFNANYDKTLKPQGITKMLANDLTPMSFTINGIDGSARPFIKKIFEMDEGEVFGPERVGDHYIVAVVTDINKPGLRSVNSVRPEVEPVIKNKKKAELITKNIGQVTTLEQVAAKTNQQIQTLDSIRFSGDRQLGYEPKVLGAAFNPANKGKVVTQPLAGSSGVFVIRVDNTGTTPVEGASIEDQRKMLEMQAQQGLMNQMQRGFNPIIETLKQAAKIKDNRAKFY